MDLDQLRNNIDEIDEQILDLFMKRMELCKGVADYKKARSPRISGRTRTADNRQDKIFDERYAA